MLTKIDSTSVCIKIKIVCVWLVGWGEGGGVVVKARLNVSILLIAPIF